MTIFDNIPRHETALSVVASDVGEDPFFGSCVTIADIIELKHPALNRAEVVRNMFDVLTIGELANRDPHGLRVPTDPTESYSARSVEKLAGLAMNWSERTGEPVENFLNPSLNVLHRDTLIYLRSNFRNNPGSK